MLGFIRKIFGRKEGVRGPGIMVRSYAPAVLKNETNFDFITNGLGEDANLYTALRRLRMQSRALWHTNSIAGKYDQTLRVNVVGPEGYTLQMRVMDKEPRVEGGKLIPGVPDVFANTLIERKFEKWCGAQYCTVTGAMNWQQVREMRVSMTARDGACMLRKIRLKADDSNPFGFTTQLLSIDCLAFDYNEPMRDGVEVRMGVERDKWGRRLAYHLYERVSGDWRYMSNDFSRSKTVRVPANEIVFSCKLTDADATLAAPWATPVMQLLYQLDAYKEAEVVAARAAACKGGYFKNTMGDATGEGVADTVNWKGENVQSVGPNETRALPYGWEFIQYDPKHPAANFAEAIKTLTQACAVGLRVPYYTLSADLADANYSSMRVGEIDVRENWKLLQTWDIDSNEIPVFDEWLECALLNQAIPLPAQKIDKFNKPYFRGRRWAWVDPVKEVEAYEKALKLGLTTRTKIIADMTQQDFEEVIQQLATEDKMLADAGLESLTLASLNAKNDPTAGKEPAKADDDEEPKPEPGKNRLASSMNGIH